MLQALPAKAVVDVGCGFGVLTSKINEVFEYNIGIDLSSVSIDLARAAWPESIFLETMVEQFSHPHKSEFEVVVCNMVLMDALKLEEFLQSSRILLKSKGRMVFSIVHPCF